MKSSYPYKGDITTEYYKMQANRHIRTPSTLVSHVEYFILLVKAKYKSISVLTSQNANFFYHAAI